ncbi:MAG TPA: copper-binding protein [Frateuria sp.]|jgi:Cu(I)/Ag(I) efflux system protein CusF|uniref:copper-binding protein n=1 Tax=Frateuria sp. TaxID=2211372 RepID=UPI002D7F177C|nr:copper-binding protein [Frateuria sp.]HET6806447.1 copper-binding protein [Frateuria sp.]
MKTIALILCLAVAPAFAGPLQMDPHMPGMQQNARPTEAQAIGVIKAIDLKQGTITLQHQAIPAIGWPAMTMPFHATPEVLKQAKVGEKVQFTLRPDGMNSVVTALKSTQS